MDTSERLAAFAAGELDVDEHASLEAELAHNPSLRAELVAIRKLDALLADLPAATPSASFSAQLRDTLRTELAQNATVTSLAEARSRRDRWQRPLTAIAAAAAVLGVVAIGINSLGDAADNAADGSSLTAMDAQSDDFAGDEGSRGTAEAAMAPPMADPVYAEGGSYDKGNLDRLGDRPDVLAALGQASLDPAAAQARNLDVLTLAALSKDPADAANGAGTTEDVQAPSLAPAPATLDNLVARCVPTVMDDDRVPLMVDVGEFEGEPALVVVLGARAADDSFSRLEYWVMSLDDDCTVRFFAQDG